MARKGRIRGKVVSWAFKLSSANVSSAIALTLSIWMIFQSVWFTCRSGQDRITHNSLLEDELYHFRRKRPDGTLISTSPSSTSDSTASTRKDKRNVDAYSDPLRSSEAPFAAKRLRSGYNKNAAKAGAGAQEASRSNKPDLSQLSTRPAGTLFRDKRLAVRIGCNWVRGPQAIELEVEKNTNESLTRFGTHFPLAGTLLHRYMHKKMRGEHTPDPSATASDDIDVAIVLHDWIGETKAWSPQNSDGKTLGGRI